MSPAVGHQAPTTGTVTANAVDAPSPHARVTHTRVRRRFRFAPLAPSTTRTLVGGYLMLTAVGSAQIGY